jgi:23S rRNA pseudouridine2605 synthase
MKKQPPAGARPSLGKRKTDNFNKFYNKKRNSAIKEALRQEKKAEKKERKEAIERHFEERRQSRAAAPGKPFPAKPAAPGKPFPAKPAAPGKPFPAKAATPGKPLPREARPEPDAGRLQLTLPAKPVARQPVSPKSSATQQPISPKPTAPGKPFPLKAAGSTPQALGKPTPGSPAPTDILPLNKYIAHGGICSRRDAATLVRQGKVTVNGQLVTEPGTKVHPTDLVKVGGKKITISNNFVYILLNKPKDYITTTDDPEGRRTVLDLIRSATTERVFPVGRLDRNTSGVLLFTNDGDLAQKLAHPSHQIRKIYHVTLDKPLTKTDFDKIAAGAVILEDGPAPIDDLAYPDPKDRTQVGLEIHSGRNRIVRRIFEQLGYDVRALDRVMYAGLTKKNVQRGHWRLLADKEVRILKYLNSSIKGSAGRAKDLAATADIAPAEAETSARPRLPRAKANGPHAGAPRPKASHSGSFHPRKKNR